MQNLFFIYVTVNKKIYILRDWIAHAFSFMVSCTFITQAKWSPLHTLSLSGLVNFMDKLLEDGVDINLFDKVSFILT